MFIQQPVRVVAEPTTPQNSPVMIDSLLYMFFTARANELSNDSCKILRIEMIESLLIETRTQVDMIVSLEVDSMDLYYGFLQTFLRKETNNEFRILSTVYSTF